jgi:drug/metabolite transporter (DMT)-like permease
MEQPSQPVPLYKIILAYIGIYLVWGSTYLAIAFAIKTLPAFLMAGVRFIIAGTILYIFARRQGAVVATRVQWRNAVVIGLLLLLGGNGGVVWAESRVPSGLTALMVASLPLWFALLDWVRPGGLRPTTRTWAGIALGMIGLLILINPAELLRGTAVDVTGAVVLLLASLSWACGSIYSRHTDLPKSGLLTTAMEMLCGGAGLLVFGTMMGDWQRFAPSSVTMRSVLAMVYLIVFGSLVGFTSYMWLLKVSTPSRVATYAYVNPVVAVLLGWAIGGESLTMQTVIATAIIVAGVVVITTAQSAKKPHYVGREEGHCPECGFKFDRSPGDACPECGVVTRTAHVPARTLEMPARRA